MNHFFLSKQGFLRLRIVFHRGLYQWIIFHRNFLIFRKTREIRIDEYSNRTKRYMIAERPSTRVIRREGLFSIGSVPEKDYFRRLCSIDSSFLELFPHASTPTAQRSGLIKTPWDFSQKTVKRATKEIYKIIWHGLSVGKTESNGV